MLRCGAARNAAVAPPRHYDQMHGRDRGAVLRAKALADRQQGHAVRDDFAGQVWRSW
jgi:hypothetical protein